MIKRSSKHSAIQLAIGDVLVVDCICDVLHYNDQPLDSVEIYNECVQSLKNITLSVNRQLPTLTEYNGKVYIIGGEKMVVGPVIVLLIKMRNMTTKIIY